MSSDILNNLNQGIEDLHPYEPGRSIDEVVAEFGHSEVVKLASNENPLGASPKALAILSELKSDMHLYPDGNGTKLRKEIANYLFEFCIFEVAAAIYKEIMRIQ